MFGARDLKKSIQKNFVSPVAKYIIKSNPQNQTLLVSSDGVQESKTETNNAATKNDEGISR